MYPIIFNYKGLIISSYGLMLMIAFILCNYLLKRYLKTININPSIGDDLIFYAAIGGIVGAKLYYILEGIPTGEASANIQGLVLIFKGIFSFSFSTITKGINQFGSGLVFLGGLIGGMISVTIYIRKNKLDWFTVSDWVAPYLILGHSIGRIGCFLVGDCYGKPSTLPWAVSFPEGLPPTTYKGFYDNYREVFLTHVQSAYEPLCKVCDGIMLGCQNHTSTVISVHPTQLYESFIYLLVFIVLCKVRSFSNIKGFVMIQYLFLAGLSRFIIEFYRVNPKYLFNMSGAQLLSLIMILFAFILYSLNKNNYYHQSNNG